MKKNLKWINVRLKIILTSLTIVGLMLTIIPQLGVLNAQMTDASINLFLKNQQSLVTDGNIDGQLSLMDEQFSMKVRYSGGRVEELNKDQYRKMLIDAEALGLHYEMNDRSIAIKRITDDLAVVTVVYEQKVKHETLDFFGYTEKMYQTMVLHSVDGEPKLLSVSSIAEKV